MESIRARLSSSEAVPVVDTLEKEKEIDAKSLSNSQSKSLDSGIGLESLLYDSPPPSTDGLLQHLNEKDFKLSRERLHKALLKLREDHKDVMPNLLERISVKDEDGRTALFYSDVAPIITKCLVQRHYGYEKKILEVLNIKDRNNKIAVDVLQYEPLNWFQQQLRSGRYIFTKKPIVLIFVNQTLSSNQSRSAEELAKGIRKFQYRVEVIQNFTAETFAAKIEEAAGQQSSGLFVFAVGFGKPGAILDINEKTITFESIEALLCSDQLDKRPKVFCGEVTSIISSGDPVQAGNHYVRSGKYTTKNKELGVFLATGDKSKDFLQQLSRSLTETSDLANIMTVAVSHQKTKLHEWSTMSKFLILEPSFQDRFQDLFQDEEKVPVDLPMDSKSFQKFEDRLITYRNHSIRSNRTATEAALAGFVALTYWSSANHSDALKCLCCELIIWNIPDDVCLLDVHQKRSENQCTFLKELATNSSDDMEVDHEEEDENPLPFVTLNKQPDSSSMQTSLFKRLGLRTFGKLFSNERVTEAKLFDIGLKSTETAAPVMAREELRASTFLTFPNEQLLDVTKLVRAGWFWTGIGLELKCCICGIIHDDWSRSVDPIVRHLQLKDNCQFLQANYTSEYLEKLKQENTEYIKPERQVIIEKVKGSWIKPLYDNPITTSVKINFHKFDLDESKLKATLYAAIEDRLKHGEPDFTSEKELVEYLLKKKEEAASDDVNGATALIKNNEFGTLMSDYTGGKPETSSRIAKKHKLPTEPGKSIDLNFRELPSRLLCSICLSNIKSTMFMPCAHITACSGCAMTQTHCPMCRSKITANANINLLPSLPRGLV